MLESKYQAGLIKRLERLFPGCLVLKNDSGYLQGIPDLSIFWGEHWAMLEVKPSIKSGFEPNQEEYLYSLNAMSFAAMICPENEAEVLDAIQRSFATRR